MNYRQWDGKDSFLRDEGDAMVLWVIKRWSIRLQVLSRRTCSTKNEMVNTLLLSRDAVAYHVCQWAGDDSH